MTTKPNYRDEFRKGARAAYTADGFDGILAFAEEKLVESFKNGIAAGKRRGTTKPAETTGGSR